MTLWKLDPLNPNPFSPVQSALKLSAVLGTTSFLRVITILPRGLPSAVMSKKTLKFAVMYFKYILNCVDLRYQSTYLFIRDLLLFGNHTKYSIHYVTSSYDILFRPKNITSTAYLIIISMIQNTNKQYFTLNRNHRQIIRDGSFATRKQYIQNTLFSLHLVETNIRLQGMLRKLHATYIHQKIPDFYAYYFLGQLSNCSPERMEDCLNRQMQLLKTKQCHFNFIQRTINARETCIKSLARCLESIFQQNDRSLMVKFSEQIKHHRHLTSLVITQIKQWKEYLLQISPQIYGDQHIAFYYQNNDYLLKILNDIDFIGQSFLSTKVIFSHKQDPFIMRPYTQNKEQRDQYSQMFRFSTIQQQLYIKCLQFLAGQRADFLKGKIAVREQKIREIEKAYQTKQAVNKILLTKPNNIFKKQREQTEQNAIDFVDQKKVEQIVRKIHKSQKGQTEMMRESKLNDIIIKGEKIKKIKNMQIGYTSPLINPVKFNTFQDNLPQKPAVIRSVSLNFLNKKASRQFKEQEVKQSQTDFESMLRKKQLQVLQSNNIKRRTYSSIRLKDRLSERKLVNDKEGAQELQRILNQLQHLAPQQEENFIIRKQPVLKQSKNLLQHNEQVLVNLRKNILKEIGDYTIEQQKVQQRTKLQNDQIQQLIRQKLQKITLRNIQQQKSKWIEGKDLLAHELGKKELFGMDDPMLKKSQKLTELQEELKKEMQMKWLRQVHEELNHRQKLNKREKQKKKEDQQRQKELEVAKRKQQQQKRFFEIEKEERLKAFQTEIQKEERRKIQIQIEMQEVIQRQKSKLQSFTSQQKIKLQNQMREAAKSKLLTKLRRQNSLYTSQLKAKQEHVKKQEEHRAQAKRRLQEQFQIQKNMERQRQREEKNRKLRLVAQKMQHIEHQISQNQLKKQEDTKKQQLQMAKSSLSQIPDFRKSNTSPVRQQNKKKMIQQFQLQLFAFNRPKEETIQKDNNILIKDFKNKMDNEQNLQGKIKQLQLELNNSRLKQKTQKLQQSKQPEPLFIRNTSLDAQSEITQRFARFSSQSNQKSKSQIKQPTIDESDLKKLGIDMSPEEYMIYIKKKAIINAKRINPLNQEQEKSKAKKILDEYQMMENIQQKEQQEQVIEKQFSFQSPSRIKKTDMSLKEQKGQPKQSPKKQKKNIQKKDKDAADLQEVMKLTVHSKITSSIKKKRFATSDDSDDDSPKKKIKKKKVKKVQSSSSQDFKEPIQHKQPQKQIKSEAVKFKKVESEDFEEYLLQHFKKLPKLIRKISLFKKDQLSKMLLQQQSVIILQISKGEQVEGVCFVVQNENKQTLRSLNIMHIGSYDASKTIGNLIKVRDKLFHVDPCSQLTLSFYYNKEDEEENKFIKQFEKQFDPYGAIFQKKINNEQTQRKHVMRRMIGEQSQNVQKNKNVGQLKINQNLFIHSTQNDFGLDIGLKDSGQSLGGWTNLSLFLSKYGNQEQIKAYLAADVKEQNKNIKYLSKSAMKLKQNLVKDIEYFEFDNPFETNLKLIEQGIDIIKCDPKIQQNDIPIKWSKMNLIMQSTLPFFSSTASFVYKKQEFTSKYLRYKCSKGTKVLKLKSNLYSNQLTVLPCKPSNYKLIITEANEFDLLKNTSLDLYMKLFLANTQKFITSSDQFIWLPQFQSNCSKKISISEQFSFKSQLRNKVELSFTEYIDNCLAFKPTHRDMFVTPPFIVAVLNSDVERLSENSPLYIERIDINNLVDKRIMHKPQPESDY